VTKQSYFGIDAEPVAAYAGAHAREFEYNNNRQVTAQHFLGVDGRPVLNTIGYASVAFVYDAQGNQTEWRYYGIDGELINPKNGFSALVRNTHENRQLVDQSYFDADGKRTNTAWKFSRCKLKWDRGGRLLEIRYFDTEDRRTDRLNRLVGFDELKSPLGEWRDLIFNGFFSVAERNAILGGGFSRAELEYDIRGNVTRAAYFDANDSPVAGPDGFSEVQVTYSAAGATQRMDCRLPGRNRVAFGVEYTPRRNLSRFVFLDAEDKAVVSAHGYAEMRFEYDEMGRRVATRRYDDQGNAVETAGD
jgi:YD repeat-containing protein